MTASRTCTSTKTLLKDRAQEVDAFLRKHFLDANGVVYSQLDKETLSPPTESFFPEAVPGMLADQDWFVAGFSRPEVAAYENCGMCTGAYLQSLVHRYEVEGSPEVLAQAGQTFDALRHIYQVGQELEEGFFPKIYGNRFTNQTSSDQALYALFAMDRYREMAPASHQSEIKRMIPELARFWMKRDYHYLYYHLEDMAWPIMRFSPFLGLAHKYSRESGFQAEYDRLLKEGDDIPQLPEWAHLRAKRDGRRELSDYEKSQKAYLVVNMADCLTMDVMGQDILLRLDPSHPRAGQWKQGILDMWEQARLTIAPNGKYYSHVLVDWDTGAVRRPAGYPEDTPSGAESGWSTMVARGAVMASEYLPEQRADIQAQATSILSQIGIPEMTYLDNPERLPPRQRFKTRFLSGDAISNWLWAYWQGRSLNLFE